MKMLEPYWNRIVRLSGRQTILRDAIIQVSFNVLLSYFVLLEETSWIAPPPFFFKLSKTSSPPPPT